ncbi:MAG: hypothetical protein HCA25_10230 [Dolichospermum sp. DET50]|nr:hypothetical protein [Dolichospermum sp. DET66]MBS3032641.1 hypothetical protein [Dolichospermum sp. DET67]MBS3037847.1 hypothetical protein [Dolichospermum sp. DET50]QSX69780.1 MAG: hypothetical protein EZY12_09455 [Dolichospermum sp. DET69]
MEKVTHLASSLDAIASFIAWSVVIGHWSLVIGQWSVVIGHWSLVIGHWSLVTKFIFKINIDKLKNFCYDYYS